MKVQIWSDVACPWCYIGKRRFEKAVEQFDGDVEIVWRSFELNPGAKRVIEGQLDEVLARKYRVSVEASRQMIARVVSEAAGEGLDFDFEHAVSGNTFDAHRLIHFAGDLGGEMAERLMKAYFCEGLDTTDHEVLAGLAAEVGLDASAALAALAAEDHAASVRDDEAEAMRIGVHSVPFFLIEERFGVPGAQLPDTFLAVLKQASVAQSTA